MSQRARHLTAGLLVAALLAAAPALAAPEGQLTLATHFTLAPTFFDPAETPGLITPFMLLYALHDALVKPMPGKAMAPSLAESWTVSPDGLVYEFVLRKGVRFHTGEPVTAEDVKFSFERYRGIFNRNLKDHVAAVETPEASRVRFRLKKPWPDFMLHYGTPATGSGWVVPKKYVEKVGEDGFKKAPVGAGPYRFVSSTPGVELVLEAFEGYWRKAPAVKRLVFKAVPDASTRLAMLKRGDTDIGFSFDGPLADEARRTPGLTLRPAPFTSTHWLVFADQWDPKSPWHDRRVRLAANHAVNQPGDQPGRGARLRQDHQQHHPDQLRVLLAAAATRARSGAGQAAARRGRLSERVRRRGFLDRRGQQHRRRQRSAAQRSGPRPASAPGCGRSSARPSSRRTRRRS